MQLHPVVVVAGRQGRGQRLPVAGPQPVEGGAEVVPVAGEPGEDPGQLVGHGQRPGVEPLEVGDHDGVVGRVAVVVRGAVGPQLPPRADLLEGLVEGQERLVGGLDLGPAAPVGQLVGQEPGMGGATVGGQDPAGDPARPLDDMPVGVGLLENVGDGGRVQAGPLCHGVTVDEAAEP